MPRRPQPKPQIGSPRTQRRTVIDDKTFASISSSEETQDPGRAATNPGGAADDHPGPPVSSRTAGTRSGRAPSREKKRTDRKGKNGDPYVRKSDGVATVPQYMTLPADLVKKLKIYAVENDMKVSEVAAEALRAFLPKR